MKFIKPNLFIEWEILLSFWLRKELPSKYKRCDCLFWIGGHWLIEENLKESNVVIGVENREGTAELPLDWDFKQLFENFNESEFIKVWHDVGHSKIKDLKKLYSQQQLIENTLPNIVGWHLHDCSDTCKDHVAIGKGDINFDALKQYFNPQKHIFTLELNYKVKTADAKDSLKRVQDLLA